MTKSFVYGTYFVYPGTSEMIIYLGINEKNDNKRVGEE